MSMTKGKTNIMSESTVTITIESDTAIRNISGVSNYGIVSGTEAGNTIFFFVKNGRKSYIPASKIIFFGNEFDYREDK